MGHLPEKWIVASIQTNGSRRAEENLARQNFQFYNPKFLTHRVVRHRLRGIEHQFFSGYIFVDSACPISSIRATRGIADVIRMGENLVTVPETELNLIRRREDDRGYVVMEKPREKFTRGQAVRIAGDSSNPLTDVVLFYECTSTRDRVRVLMKLLGRMVPMELRENALVAA